MKERKKKKELKFRNTLQFNKAKISQYARTLKNNVIENSTPVRNESSLGRIQASPFGRKVKVKRFKGNCALNCVLFCFILFCFTLILV